MNTMLCGYRDDPRQWDLEETAREAYGKRLEDHTEFLVDQIASVPEYAHGLIRDYELDQSPLLEEMMKLVAAWSGRTDGVEGSAELMPKLHACLFRNLRDTVAESEVE